MTGPKWSHFPLPTPMTASQYLTASSDLLKKCNLSISEVICGPSPTPPPHRQQESIWVVKPLPSLSLKDVLT